MVDQYDFRVIANDCGALALELYVLESTPEKSPEDVIKLPVPLDYQRDPEERESLVPAGPRTDATCPSIVCAGLITYRAGLMTEVRQLADADPTHHSGARQFVTQVADQRGQYLVERWPVHGQGLA